MDQIVVSASQTRVLPSRIPDLRGSSITNIDHAAVVAALAAAGLGSEAGDSRVAVATFNSAI